MAFFTNIAKNFNSARKNVGSIFATVAKTIEGILGRGRRVRAPENVPPIPPIFAPPTQPSEADENEEGFLDDTLFIFFEEPYTDFESSNVVSFLYSRQDQKLTVGYKGRRSASEVGYYEYRPVSEEEAREVWRAISKGGWVWDKLRVRGTKCGHQKDYVFLSAPSSWHPRLGCNVWGTSRKQGKFP